MTEFVV